MRAVLLVATVLVARGTAHAAPAAPPASAPSTSAVPDEIADIESREANLEPDDPPRVGWVFAVAGGFGVVMGGDSGIGRGPALSLRLGHVATRRTVITFEITAGSALHKPATESSVVTDTNGGVMVGAQRYTSGSTWLRGAGGIAVLTADVGGAARTSRGLAGLVGGGLDLVRWGTLVVGVETSALASITRDGPLFQVAFALGLSYY